MVVRDRAARQPHDSGRAPHLAVHLRALAGHGTRSRRDPGRLVASRPRGGRSERGRAAVIEELGQLRAGTTIWVDLHDYDGGSAFHEPFVRNADVVFMNADAVDDPWELARSCVQRGPRLAVCTLGADGAIAVDETGQRLRVAAPGVDRLVDSNGAATHSWPVSCTRTCEGLTCADASRRARQAAVALSTRHLHPALDSLIET
jgi:hypothetical protein